MTVGELRDSLTRLPPEYDNASVFVQLRELYTPMSKILTENHMDGHLFGRPTQDRLTVTFL